MSLRGLARSRPLLALAAGAAAALAHPPFGFLPGLLGWGLMWALWERSDARRPLRSAFLSGWLSGFAYFLIGCWWVAEAFFVDPAQAWMAPFAAALLPAGLGLFWGTAAALYRRLRPRRPWLKPLMFAALLSLLEWLRGHLLTGFPWNLPGETWAAGSQPSQAAALVGAYGLSWITLIAAAALACPFVFGAGRRAYGGCAAGAALIAALYGYGALRLAGARTDDPGAPIVRVVQADIPQSAKYDEASFRSIFNRYLTLTAAPAARRPDIVLWPEGAIPAAANDYLAPSSWTAAAILAATRPGQSLLVGAYHVEAGPDGAPIYFNSLIGLRRGPSDLRITALYDKHRLVPFGEYLPLERLLAPLGVKKMVHVGDSFSAGPPPRPIAPSGMPPLQPLICYESLYPGLAREGTAPAGPRPRWIVNVSNDAWFGRTSGPWQHLNLASYRAIEEGLPIVRATPTGVSAIIDAYGRSRPARQLAPGRMGVLDAALPAAAPPTPFSRWGDWPFGLVIGLTFAACLAGRLMDDHPRRIVSGAS